MALGNRLIKGESHLITLRYPSEFHGINQEKKHLSFAKKSPFLLDVDLTTNMASFSPLLRTRYFFSHWL
jgi:hypothetical protein